MTTPMESPALALSSLGKMYSGLPPSDFASSEDLQSLILIPYLFIAGFLVVALAVYMCFTVALMLTYACPWPLRRHDSKGTSRYDGTNAPPTDRVVPKHIAVIMDGNRRYGKQHYGKATQGHHAGGQTLKNFVDWCRAEGVEMLTCYAFSTENWKRSQAVTPLPS